MFDSFHIAATGLHSQEALVDTIANSLSLALDTNVPSADTGASAFNAGLEFNGSDLYALRAGYNLVGNDQVDEPWLDEALTNYSTLIYVEDVHGQQEAQFILVNYFEGPYQQIVETSVEETCHLDREQWIRHAWEVQVYSCMALQVSPDTVTRSCNFRFQYFH